MNGIRYDKIILAILKSTGSSFYLATARRCALKDYFSISFLWLRRRISVVFVSEGEERICFREN